MRFPSSNESPISAERVLVSRSNSEKILQSVSADIDVHGSFMHEQRLFSEYGKTMESKKKRSMISPARAVDIMDRFFTPRFEVNRFLEQCHPPP